MDKHMDFSSQVHIGRKHMGLLEQREAVHFSMYYVE
jgi:hypothetical protein